MKIIHKIEIFFNTKILERKAKNVKSREAHLLPLAT